MKDSYQGRIYISSAFTNLPYVKCKPNTEWLDNDPHFWSSPPTWGICRTDYRRVLSEGDYVFFVLPKHTNLPQMIYGHMRIFQKMTHVEAFKRLPHKRMKDRNPNGNIIVDVHGAYNPFDLGVHLDRFDEIKKHYMIGDKEHSQFLKPKAIQRLAPSFLATLNRVFGCDKQDIFSIIGRKGRVLDKKKVDTILRWLSSHD
jgi:hypothetical protein